MYYIPVEQPQPPRLPAAAAVRRGQLVQSQVSAGGRAAAPAAAPLVPEPLAHAPDHVLERLTVAGGGLVVEESVLRRLVALIVGEGINNAFQVLCRGVGAVVGVRVGVGVSEGGTPGVGGLWDGVRGDTDRKERSGRGPVNRETSCKYRCGKKR